jgi:hypothetical protein
LPHPPDELNRLLQLCWLAAEALEIKDSDVISSSDNYLK